MVRAITTTMGVKELTPSRSPTAVEAIRLATLGGAARAGASNKIGAIEPGMRADIVALGPNDPAFRPLHSVAKQVVYSETGRSVRHVWVDGRHVVANGAATRIDENKLLDEMAAVMPAVTKQLDNLRGDALTLKGYFAELQAKAWARPLIYNRLSSAVVGCVAHFQPPIPNSTLRVAQCVMRFSM